LRQVGLGNRKRAKRSGRYPVRRGTSRTGVKPALRG
jgi:hypothetical protein